MRRLLSSKGPHVLRMAACGAFITVSHPVRLDSDNDNSRDASSSTSTSSSSLPKDGSVAADERQSLKKTYTRSRSSTRPDQPPPSGRSTSPSGVDVTSEWTPEGSGGHDKIPTRITRRATQRRLRPSGDSKTTGGLPPGMMVEDNLEEIDGSSAGPRVNTRKTTRRFLRRGDTRSSSPGPEGRDGADGGGGAAAGSDNASMPPSSSSTPVQDIPPKVIRRVRKPTLPPIQDARDPSPKVGREGRV